MKMEWFNISGEILSSKLRINSNMIIELGRGLGTCWNIYLKNFFVYMLIG